MVSVGEWDRVIGVGCVRRSGYASIGGGLNCMILMCSRALVGIVLDMWREHGFTGEASRTIRVWISLCWHTWGGIQDLILKIIFISLSVTKNEADCK